MPDTTMEMVSQIAKETSQAATEMQKAHADLLAATARIDGCDAGIAEAKTAADAAKTQAEANAAEIASVKSQTETVVNEMGQTIGAMATSVTETAEKTAANEAAIAEVKETAEAALPKSGGEMTGPVTFKGHDAGGSQLITFNDDVSGTSKILGIVRNSFYDANDGLGKSSIQSIEARNFKQDGSQVNSSIRAYALPDGTAFATTSHPRTNNYGMDIATMKALKDYAPMKTTTTLTAHVGGANASDTADLFAGRGLSADKPFKTPRAALAWMQTNAFINVNALHLRLHEDVTWEDETLILRSGSGRYLMVSGTPNTIKITIPKYLAMLTIPPKTMPLKSGESWHRRKG